MSRARRGPGAGRLVLPAALLLALACTSCAAGNRLQVPVPRAGEPPLRWPPLPADGYVTADGTRHELPGGYVIEYGDSLLFVQREEPYRPALLTPKRSPASRMMLRDSVRSIAVRMEETEPNPAAGIVGGALLLGIVGMFMLLGGVYPFYPWAYGS